MKKDYLLISDINMSLLNDEERDFVYHVLQESNISLTEILPSQRLALYGVSDSQRSAIEEKLFSKLSRRNGIRVTYVQACPGLNQCKYGMGDALSLGRSIEQLSFDNMLPHKVKVSIAGCAICCTEPYVRDVGIIAKKAGWTMVFGGNAGGKPRIADHIASGLTKSEALQLIKKCLLFYIENAGTRQRTARFIEQYGIDNFKKNISL